MNPNPNFPPKPKHSRNTSGSNRPERSPGNFSRSVPGSTEHYREVGAAVLGAMMLEKDALQLALEIIPDGECFYHEAQRVVFEVIRTLAGEGRPADLLTVTEELIRTGNLQAAGGPVGVTSLSSNVLSTANLETHTRVLMEQWVKRSVVGMASELHGEGMADTTDAFDLLDQAETSLARIASGIIKTPFRPLGTTAGNLLKSIREDRAAGREVVGISSGLKSLDEITSGFHPGNLIIIAARPGVGKTAFGLNIATRCAAMFKELGGCPTAFFSLEMSEEELTQRILADAASVELGLVRNPIRLSEEGVAKLDDAATLLQSRSVYLDDTAALSIPEFRTKARRLVLKHGVGLILIDYLQLMSGDTKRNGNREQEVAQISRELKKIAKELHIPIVAFSQMSRGVESRSDKKPQLSDLRESGALEQDADMVGFLYRPSEEELIADPSLVGTGNLAILKNRHGGAPAMLYYRFVGEYQRWEELSASGNSFRPVVNSNPTLNRHIATAANVPEDLPF